MRGLLERLLARRRQAAGEGVPDVELLRRFTRENDEAAFELLVWRHGGMVLAVCRRAIRDEQLAEDAFQAVFLVLARKAAAIRGNLGGWLFKVARRVAFRAMKNRQIAQPVTEQPVAPTADAVTRDELSVLLDAEIAQLPERLRRPVVLCYLGGHSTEDAARELGCPRGTVLSRLAAARKRLAERLTRRGVTLPTTLAVVGLSGPLISRTSAAATAFRNGSFTFSNATQLAEGILRIMRRTTVSIAMGGVLLAAGLVTGFGWVASQQGTKAEAAGLAAAPEPTPQPAPVAVVPPVNPPKPLQPDPAAERKALDDRRKKLERLAESIRSEIDATEKQIELLAKAGGVKDDFRQMQLQKHSAEVEEEFRKAARELIKLEAEISVLKKMLDGKEQLPLDPALVQEMVNRNPAVMKATAELEKARDELRRVVRLGLGGETPQIKNLKDEIADLEKKLDTTRTRGTAEAAKLLQASEITSIQARIAKLDIEHKIKKEIREKLREERDSVKKLLDLSTDGAVNIVELHKSLEPQREALTKIQRELLLLRVQREGITLTEQVATDAKLDAILRELAALRNEVKELKEQRKK